MPKTKPESITQAAENLVAEALASPEKFLHWSELLSGAEKTGRIARSKQSALMYCLHKYVLRRITDDATFGFDLFRVRVAIGDEYVELQLTCIEQNVKYDVVVPYPDWLFEFFEDETHAALLEPSCPEKLEEVLQQIYEFCFGAGYIVLEEV